MNRKELSDDLKQNPRVELLPSLLNLPIVVGILVVLLVVPDARTIINGAAANIFGIESDFVAILEWLSALALILIPCLTILALFWRKKTPVFLHVIPGVLFLIYESLLIFAINNDPYLTINYIYENLGYDLSLVLYLTLAIVLLNCLFLLVEGIPRLWNTRQDSTSRFHPRALAIITIVSSFLAFSFIGLFLIGHDSIIFWQVILYDIDWSAFLTVFHETCIIAFVAVGIVQKKKHYLISRFNLVDSRFTKVLSYLRPSLLILQALPIILIGIYKGFPTTLLSPLSLITYTECLSYLFHDFIFPRFNKLSSSSRRGKNEHHIKSTIVVAPLIWIVLFQPLISLPPEPNLPVVELNVVRNTYATMSVTQRTLFDNFLNYAIPPGTTQAQLLSAGSEKSIARIASGMLFRNGPGDVENASFILDYLVDDENHSPFVGCELILILERHQSKLDPALVSRIEEKLVLCAESAYAINERPTYTNMALMGAFVMTWVGVHADRPEIRDAGIRKSWAVFLLFQRNNTFSEFNSPTYGGVDMIAITMWRELGPTETMRRMGAIMEQAFWRELSAFYHAGFKNLVGPYFRKYGMDMHSYTAIIGIWIALAIDDLDKAPLPSSTDFENSNIFSAVQLGHSIPSPDVLQEFTEFSRSRYLERRVPSDISNIGKEYTVTAMLHPEWMMGGVSGRVYAGGQFATGTLTWNSTDDSLAWLLVSGKDKLDVVVSTNSMQIRQTRTSTRIVFYVNCHDLTTNVINGTTWSLPGIKLKIDVDPSKVTTDVVDKDQFRGDFEIRETVHDIVRVACLTDQISLQINN